MTASRYLNVLVAWPYLKADVVALLASRDRSQSRLIVDSGAFTAWNTGRVLHLDDYCRFLDSIDKLRPFYAVQLDVFGDPDKTHKNLRTMQARGYDVMPVFTRGDSFDVLDALYDCTDYIMFGGIVTGGKNKAYVKYFLDKNRGRKAHWLGFVDGPFMRRYRPESVDSSVWATASIYGLLKTYPGQGGLYSTGRQQLAAQRVKIEPALRRIGAHEGIFHQLRHDQAWRHGMSQQHKLRLSDFLTCPRGLVQFLTTLACLARMIDVERTLGTKVYQAAASAKQLAHLLTAHEHACELRL